MEKPLPFDRNIIAVAPKSDIPEPVTLKPLAPSEKRQHQGATPRAAARNAADRSGLAIEADQRETPREQHLWVAVIMQALDDATMPPPQPVEWVPTTSRRKHGANLTRRRALKLARQRAIEWFEDGGRDFHDVCLLAGLDPDAVREGALRVIRSRQADEKAETKPSSAPRSPFMLALLGHTALSPVPAPLQLATRKAA